MSDERDICCYKNCKNDVGIKYYDKPLCDKHWTLLCDKTVDEMKTILKVKEPKNL